MVNDCGGSRYNKASAFLFPRGTLMNVGVAPGTVSRAMASARSRVIGSVPVQVAFDGAGQAFHAKALRRQANPLCTLAALREFRQANGQTRSMVRDRIQLLSSSLRNFISSRTTLSAWR